MPDARDLAKIEELRDVIRNVNRYVTGIYRVSYRSSYNEGRCDGAEMVLHLLERRLARKERRL